MTDISLGGSALVAIAPRALHTLRDRAGPQVLQEAGYAAGEATYAAFAKWLPGVASVDDPKDLAAPRIGDVLSRFFGTLGWGKVAAEPLADAAFAFDSSDWAEAQPDAHLEYPGCYFTAGLLADMVSRVAESPLAVMEVECRSKGDGHCRWLVGSPETLTALYEKMSQGTSYQQVLAGK